MSHRRLAIIENETLVREGLKSLFAARPEFEVVHSVETIRDLEFMNDRWVNVALVGVGSLMPDIWDRLAAVQSSFAPRMSIVALDDRLRDFSLRRVLQKRLFGYATRSDSFEDIATVVAAAARGEQAFSTAAQSRLTKSGDQWKLRVDERPGLHLLTLRETEVLALVAEGHTSDACAKRLHLSPSTIDNHKSRIMKKLQVRRTADLVRIAVVEGLVPGYHLTPDDSSAR